MVFLRTEITYFFGQQILYISCRIACEKRQLDLAEKKLLHNNYNFGLVGKKYMTKNHGNTQVSTLNWVKVLQKEKNKFVIQKFFNIMYLTLF